MSGAKLTLGPVLFNWAPERWRDFHFRMAEEAAIDTVGLGEVVCAKRRPLFAPHFTEVVERYERAGKEIVFSTLALVMDGRELDEVREMATSAEGWYVEANDIAATSLLAGRRHAIGPYVNVFNEGTLGWLAARGADRICPPVELPAESLAALAAAGVAEIEVVTFGRLPLALSARCYHARARGLHKDNCRFACEDDPDGMAVETLDGDPFLAVNGTQVLSHGYCNLLGALTALETMGIHRFRLSPHDIDMVAVARAHRDVLEGREGVEAASARLAERVGGATLVDGFYRGEAGADALGASQ